MIKEHRVKEAYTPTQQRILKLLSDGQRHPRAEVFDVCIGDDLLDRALLNDHISRLRKKLRPLGQDIICESSGRGYFFRHVRLLCNPHNGK